jgi:hypothetical protein
MATDTTMRRAVREIAGAMTKYAHSQGWGDEDYWIYFNTNPEWGRIHFVFVAKGFDGRDSYERYKSVWDFLGKELGQDREILNSLNLVVNGKNEVDRGGIYRIGPEYEDYREYWTFSRPH